MELINLMPPFWRDDAKLAALLGAVNAAVSDYLTDAQALLQSGAASTADEPWIAQWERLYLSPPADGMSVPDRRSAIMAKMRAGGICSPWKLHELAAAYYSGEIEITEDPENSTVTIEFIGQQGTPPFIAAMRAEIAAVLPVHLTARYKYKYLSIAEVKGLTIAELQETHLDRFAGGA